jgi:hypothetical protein
VRGCFKNFFPENRIFSKHVAQATAPIPADANYETIDESKVRPATTFKTTINN